MPAIDYASTYADYWQRPDRWGSSSFADPVSLADQILATCGPGPLVDVGCGMGLLVRTLLARAVDARAVDVAPRCVEAGNAAAPGRFVEGSVLSLPFPDASFDTVVSTDVLEHLAEEDVDRAVAELARVARRALFLRISTVPDRDNAWHLTVRPRAWWEERLFRAGLRKHPLAQKILSFASLEHETSQITIVLEKIPADAARAYPLESLAPTRDLHMDMLRESGRRSDAHLARYTLACEFVRPGDTVVDAACGMGYGAAILAAGSRAARVLGVDLDAGAVEYARANFGGEHAPLEFRAGDAADLSFLPDHSADLITAFECLEHVADPRRTLAEFRRVLTPGGRLIVSVPNNWADQSGRDPNPHHLRLYTWESLSSQLAEVFLIERAWIQTAGGGMKLADAPRRLDEADFDADPESDHALRSTAQAEWYLALAMKSPLDAPKEGYRETAYPDQADLPGYNLTAFARDYDNPWLVRSIVSIGMRCTNPVLLEWLARRAASRARRGSPDQGAALCVLGYRLLEQESPPGAAELLDTIEDYQQRADGSPQAWRWRISTLSIAARLRLAAGDRAAARETFLRCARTDCTAFSPLLASRTIDASFQAGVISALDGDKDGARACWIAGLEEARRVLAGDWTNIWGSAAHPVTFGLPEVAVLADLASRCSYALDALSVWDQRPGLAWRAAARQTFADGRQWLATLSGANSWLASQLGAAGAHQRRLEEHVARLEERLRSENGAFQEELRRLDAAKNWLADHAAAWKQTAEQREKSIAELRDWNQQLQTARDYLGQQSAAWEKAAKDREAELARLRAWVEELTEGKRWLEGQVAAWRATAEERDRLLARTSPAESGAAPPRTDT